MRSEVGVYTSITSTVAHSLTTTPKAGIFLANTTVANSTRVNGIGFSGMFSTFSSVNNQGVGWHGGVTVLSTFRVASTQGAGLFVKTDGSTDFGSTVVVSGATTASFVSSGTGGNAPIVYGLIGGDDVQANVIQTSVGTSGTVTSTGWGFQPNCVITLARTTGTSAASWSFGACATVSGQGTSMDAWSIGQVAREAALVNANGYSEGGLGGPPTFNAFPYTLMLSTGTVRQPTSPTALADGFSFFLDLPSPGSQLLMLGLKVPQVAIGKTSVAGNALSVAGLGGLVSNVVLASLGSSLDDSFLTNNHFSIGIASSNGAQGSVAGFGKDGAAIGSGAFMNYVSSNKVLTFLSTAGIVSQGTLAFTTDGFTITMSNTAASGWQVYWAALSNIVNEVASNIRSSASLTANLTSVQTMASNILSSASITANLTEVGLLSANIQSSFAITAFMQREFDPVRSNARAIANTILRINQGRERHVFKMHTTESPAFQKTIDVTTDRQRIGMADALNAKLLGVLPASTNTYPIRLASGRQPDGFQLSSRGMSVFRLSTGTEQDMFVYCTVSGASIPTRVLLR